MIRKNDINETESVDLSRRKILLTGAKYAALVPASTVLVAKSARAGGSAPSYTYPSGGTATTPWECVSAYQSPPDTFDNLQECFDTVGIVFPFD